MKGSEVEAVQINIAKAIKSSNVLKEANFNKFKAGLPHDRSFRTIKHIVKCVEAWIMGCLWRFEYYSSEVKEIPSYSIIHFLDSLKDSMLRISRYSTSEE